MFKRTPPPEPVAPTPGTPTPEVARTPATDAPTNAGRTRKKRATQAEQKAVPPKAESAAEKAKAAKQQPSTKRTAAPATRKRALSQTKILVNDPDLGVKIITRWSRFPFPSLGKIVEQLKHEHPRLSKSAAVQILRNALQNDLVTAHVNLPIERTECLKLELALQDAFPELRVAKVVRVSPVGLDDDDPKVREPARLDVLRRLVALAAGTIDAFITERAGPDGRPTTTVGIGWGITMYRLLQHLASSRRPTTRSPLEFVPVVAPSTRPQEVGIDSNSLTMRIAECYRATAWGLNCSSFPKNVDAISIRGSEDVKPILTRIARADLIVNSIAGVNYDASLSEDSRVMEELLSSDPKRTAVGRFGFWFWNARGNEVPLQRRRPIGIGLQGLRRAALDPKRSVVTVTGGDLSRGPALLGALRGYMISHLITDDLTARWLLDHA